MDQYWHFLLTFASLAMLNETFSVIFKHRAERNQPQSRNLSLLFQDVTCAECETFLGKIATLLETPDFAAIVAADLEGAVFCENADYIEAANVDTCKTFMAMVDKQAVAALGSLLRVSASRICTDSGCTY